MAHSPGPYTVEDLPAECAELALGLTHIVCGPCQIPEELGQPVAVAFTFSADDAILFASVLDLLEAAEDAVEVLSGLGVRFVHRREAALERLRTAIAKARRTTP
jgi:hypothetical protein